MLQDTTRTARVEARISPDVLAVVRRAAELEGRSVSDFMVTAARNAAEKSLEESQVIRLTAEEQLRFVELLLNPPPLSPAMKRAREAHKRLMTETE